MDASVTAALASFGLDVLRVEPITAMGPAKRHRAVYRVVLASGRTVKVRRLEDEATAARLVELRRDLPAAFSPVLARHGEVLLEAWIDGQVLGDMPPADDHVDQAAALLAGLHATETLAGARIAADGATASWTAETEHALRGLLAAGRLDEPSAARLADAVAARDPRQAPVGLVHLDLCGENLVIDAGGRLHVVDNERVSIAPLGFDVARTSTCWQLAPAAWDRFRSAYLAVRPHAVPLFATLPYWRLVALAKSAAVRVRLDPARAHLPLERLVSEVEGPEHR